MKALPVYCIASAAQGWAPHAAGGMLGGFFATNVGSTRPLGMEGWRFSFHLMAALALVTVYLLLRWAVDPRPPARAVLAPIQLGGSTQ
jgi:hypothetical protein